MKQRSDNFDKFNRKKNSAVKEAYRQEKKKIKQEARAAGEAMRQRKLDKQRGITSADDKPAAKKNYSERKPARKFSPRAENKAPKPQPEKEATTGSQGRIHQQPELMPLNKFIAHAGICARREAAELVKQGQVSVNGDRIFEPGFKVSGRDKVAVNGKQVFLQKNAVYILLNKPKDYITTANDPQGRKTVLDLIKPATRERVFPVGRLDRNTTGVLLLTNDGELAQQLTHPSFEVKKIYEVTLDKPLLKKDMDSLVQGITLEDGFVKADAAGYPDSKNKMLVGVEIHSGRNRIVRRMFEHLGYDVKGLDRVMFANLTKKNVDRGKWRLLQEKEIRQLKYMNQSFVRKQKKEA